MNANELADAMEIRASIRRKATSRKSVTEGANDRLADQLEQAATMLRQQEVEIERITSKHEEMLRQQQAEIEALKAGKIRAYDNGVEDGRKPNTNLVKELTEEKSYEVVFDGEKYTTKLLEPKVKELTDEEINVVAILQDAEIVPVGHEIWKTGEEFNKYKRIVLATAKALRKAQEK